MTLEEKRIQKVKHQLMDYGYYKAVERELEEKIKAIDERLNDGGVRGVSLSEKLGGTREGNWIIEIISEQDALLERLHSVRVILRETDEWMNALPEYERKAVQSYVIKHNCTDADYVALSLGMAHHVQLIRVVQSAFNFIIENFKIY